MTLLTLLFTCTTLITGAPPPQTQWRWPLGPPVPHVLRAFAPPPAPWLPGHRGVDLAARPDQPVYAAGRGRVSYAGRLAGRGVIAISHGALRTTYLPVRSALRPGHRVAPGTRIGTVERVPVHCAVACLHWGLRNADGYLDPLLLVRPRIRLLPRWPTSLAAPVGSAVPALPAAPPDSDVPSGPPAPTVPVTAGRPSTTALPDAAARPLSSASTPPSAPPSVSTASPRPRPKKEGESVERPADQPVRLVLRDATTATGGAVTGMLLAFALVSLRQARARGRSRRRPPPDVIDLTRERRLRRFP
ncbi:peptidoglycan DD-metalloendopeptidase family protein [Spirillospora sp. NPDC127200]